MPNLFLMKKQFVLLLITWLLFQLPMDGKRLTTSNKIRVACVGNSVTYGYGLKDPATQSYPSQLQRMLGEGYDVRNFGHSGATLLYHGHRPYVKEPEFKRALDFKADMVVIHLGLNDTDPRNWPDYGDEFLTDYRALIDSFRMANRNAKIWICRMTPIFHRHPRFQSGTRDWHADIQQVIEKVAESADVGLIDLHEPLYNHPELFPDALHPNEEGAGIIAKTVFQTLTGNFGPLVPSPMYGNGMVIQRNVPIVFHGTASAGKEVAVTFNGCSKTICTGTDGKWSTTFPAMEAGGPYRLSFSTQSQKKTKKQQDDGQTIVYDSVWVGEVWLCSGQSNMEFPLSSTTTAEEDKALFSHPSSFISYCDLSTLYPTDNVEWSEATLDSVNHLRLLHQPRWQQCTAENVSRFSAIATHFGRVLADSLQIPIGIICNAVGGTTTESWIDRHTLEWEFPNILYDWYHADYGQAWARGRALKNIAKAADTKLQRHPYEPAYMFEAGILPLDHYYIKGVAWYQGESNANNIELHERLFKLMEKSWREYFGRRNLPFCFVQLSGLNRPSWPRFRDSQRRLANQLSFTWMVVSHDVGDEYDVHYRNKRPIGERLAQCALGNIYRRPFKVEEPTLVSVNTEGNNLYVQFNKNLKYSGKELLGFEVAGADGLFHEAIATISDKTVTLRSPEVSLPVEMRYAWQPYTKANLTGITGYPVSAFSAKASLSVEVMKGFPSSEKGIEKGVSACYAGTIDNRLMMAGGCNFPEIPAAEGGKKRYYRGIYVAELNEGTELHWKQVGWLPAPAAYGVSVTTDDGIICIGGNNEKESLRSVFKIRLRGGKAVVEPLPSLPVPMDNFTGSLWGNHIDIYADTTWYSLELNALQQGWKQQRTFNVRRVQPVSGHYQGEFCVWGGFSPKDANQKASLSLNGMALGKETRRRATPVTRQYQSVFLGGGAAVNVSENVIVALGGVNKNIFLNALNNPAPDYMTHEPSWYQFNANVFLYDGYWRIMGQSEHTARAGATVVCHQGKVYVIGGELKPGIRVPEVSRLTLYEK